MILNVDLLSIGVVVCNIIDKIYCISIILNNFLKRNIYLIYNEMVYYCHIKPYFYDNIKLHLYTYLLIKEIVLVTSKGNTLIIELDNAIYLV